MAHDTHASYLSRLKFDPSLLKSWVASYITNIRLVILLVLTVSLLGILSYFNLPRRLNPEINIPIITVATVFPGASPEDVESLVTIPIENELRGLADLDTITSSSRDNVSIISMQFFSTVNRDKAKDTVQSAVDTVTGLPEEVQRSQVTALDFEDQPIWQFALESTNGDVPSLMQMAKKLEKEIEDLTKVDRVTISGFETQEIVIEINQEKVRDFGISPIQLSQAVQNATKSFPSGLVTTGNYSFSVTIDPVVTSVDDLRNIKIPTQTVPVLLSDVALIREQSTPNQVNAYYANNEKGAQQVVTFDVYKTKTAKINEAESDVRTRVEEILKPYDSRFTTVTISNNAEEITRQFSDLLGEFRSTIILVFGCLLLFLGLRQAIIASLTVPLTFLAVFVFMSLIGMSINFLSLFAFLLSLGLLIDDTIVVVSAMTLYHKTKKFTPLQTGLLVWKDTIIPIWSTTITTIWSFVPLLLSTGIIGEFIKPIPVVVTVTMISSTAIAVLVTLPFMVTLLGGYIAKRVLTFAKILGVFGLLLLIVGISKDNQLLPIIVGVYLLTLFAVYKLGGVIFKAVKNSISKNKSVGKGLSFIKKYSDTGFFDIEILSEKYYKFIVSVLESKTARRNVIIGIIAYTIFAFALIPLGLVKNEFFPKADSQRIFVNLELPSGSNLQQTKLQTQLLLDELRHIEPTEFVIAQIGTSIGDFGASSDTVNRTLFTLHLPEEENRDISSIDLAQNIRKKYESFDGGTISVTEESGGPPAGADLQITLLGEDLIQLDAYADNLVQHLKNQEGIVNVKKSIKPGTSALTFVPDTQKLAQYGIDVQSIGLWMRTYGSGFTLEEVNFDDDNENSDINFRFSSTIPTIEELSRIAVPSQTGPVPLISLGEFKTKTNPTVINREEGKRTISVSAGVVVGFSISDLNKKLEEFADGMNMTAGYGWKTGGVNEENAKSVQSILQAMVLSAVLILVTMVIQFGSYRQAIIVLSVIPVAVSSVFVLFALTGTPLSFPALIGVLSLFGIVVTNSMFIVDKININLRQKMPFIPAIADAGSSRMEPIILTKLATVLGLLPITLADPLWRGLGGAIISGLLLASTIMLLFIPVFYYQWFSGSAQKK